MKTPAIRTALSLASTISLIAFADPASAQAPGTNVATPPPAQAPASPLGANAPGSMAQATPVGLAQEPVIEPSATRTVYPNRPLLITGAVLLSASYGAAAIVAATSERGSDNNLYYPVAGPWLTLNERDCNADPCSHEDRDTALLIGDGIVQGLGALTMVMSLFVPERTTRSWYLIGSRDFIVVPQLHGSSIGLGTVGRF